MGAKSPLETCSIATGKGTNRRQGSRSLGRTPEEDLADFALLEIENNSPVDGSDPLLLRQLSAIGNNINQIARTMHAACITGEWLQTVEVLTVLVMIEKQLNLYGLIPRPLGRYSDV